MEKDWVKVYISQFPHKVEIMKALLEDNDIDCVIMNKQDSSYLFGYLELYVEAINVIQANQIIQEHENK
jgi:hypothetical protein